MCAKYLQEEWRIDSDVGKDQHIFSEAADVTQTDEIM